MSALALIARDPVLRMAALLMFLNGALVASFGPYTALIAVRALHLSNAALAGVLVVSTLLSVLASLWVGIRTDQKASRRNMALWAGALGAMGLALMSVAPSQPGFLLAHALLLPLSSTLFGQLFALARLAASRHAPDQREPAMGAIRAIFALPFVIVLPLWALAFKMGAPLLAIYPVSLALSLAMTGLTWAGWPQDKGASWDEQPSGLSLRAALRELAHPALTLRLLALGAISAMPAIYTTTLGLVLTQTGGRPASDPGLFFGLVAGAEVPFMLAVPLLARRLPRLVLIFWAAVLAALVLLALPVLAGGPFLWLLVPVLAAAHGVLLTLPISYLQDLLSNRPGTGAALLSLQFLIGNALAAAAFALGTALSGYGLALVMAAVLGVAGALVLLRADRAKP